jgi:3-oxoacyl-(acyl-carrier-protein) synthase/acyl carrier protein/SAM-dependent methyltransferase
MLERCASRLADVLTGSCEPLTLLFPNGSLGAAEALYQDSPFSRFYNSIAQAVVSALVGREPGRSLRVLEIGAGTGGTTAYVVPKLPAENVEYVFSDVSRMFLGKAERKFAAYPFMRYEVLDIEKDPVAQGFEPNSFDVIIAANVLHATLDLEATVRNAKSLLARDGSIVVLENTAKQRMLDLIFGLTEGWWRYADTTLRHDSALLSEAKWKELFARVGFRAACAFPAADKALTASEQAVLVARGIDAPVAQPRVRRAPAPVVVAKTTATTASTTSSANDLERFAMDRVVAEVARSLRQDPQQIALDKNFLDLGLDSLMAVEIVASLKAKLGVTLSATVLFEHTTIEALSAHLAAKFAPALRAALADADPTPSISTAPPPAVEIPRERTEQVMPAAVASAPAPSVGREDIAIIGLGCNFPNGANVDAFWRSLVENRDSVAEIPASRWETSAVKASKHAALLERLDLFDAQFFEIAPREAKLIDPQQRMMLEVAWETIEHAGYGGQLFGKDVGVFIGASNTDYFEHIKPTLTADDYAAGLGNKTFIIPNRISYFMNWRGPSVLVDTACSSSLVALQQAVEALRRGDCSYALVGGVNVLLSPAYYEALNRMGVQAPDGRCKAFDHRADGFVTGEGAGAILLKSAAQALADGDTIYAVIKGAAVNHNGKSAGLVAPNPAAHAEVIARAYEDAKVSPETVSYVEAHGTGTALGDVIEMQGLTMAFRRFTEKTRFCTLGSVKTNIGHLEPAAGIASVIKVVLSMWNKTIPATLHFEKENPSIAFSDSPFVVRGENVDWTTADGGPLRAGVSSFGMGGTNAHVVLEAAPPSARREMPACTAYVLPLSARTDAALKNVASRYKAWIETHQDASFADVCFTAAAGRAHMRHRVAVVGTRDEVLVQLARIAASDDIAATADEALGVFYGVVKRRVTTTSFEPNADVFASAKAFVEGADIAREMGMAGGKRIALPTYPFERTSHWVEIVEEPKKSPSKIPPPVHPFLIKRLS